MKGTRSITTRLIVALTIINLLFSACTDKNTLTTHQATSIQNNFKKPSYVPAPSPYRASNTRVSDLIHTKLDVSFDWNKQYLNGKAQLVLKPYFYSQNTVVLDAKGFDVHEVELVKEDKDLALKYDYDNLKLTIYLDKTYSKDEEYILNITYTAKPNELKVKGSDAIKSDKGLYFINPTGEEKDKPRQIWTQGETEASSCWFPTIDSPNEKSTQEIYITVDTIYSTLSNGYLVYSRTNADGTRTDYWKQEKPHAPYLFMMVVGEFAIVKDQWRDIELSYWVEKPYEKYAKSIFGKTPQMMEFFSTILDYPYPWDKYAQIVVRDYVSGAMENTSASIFLEQIQMTDRELLDKDWDFIVAHELFHHWFGDLVTCESWSNLPLNESFANYSEYLWYEHAEGRDYADYHGENELDEYLQESLNKQVPVVRFNYEDKEDMFDRHSYNKGGRILHMLRKHIGDDAFFASLNLYLKNKEYQSAEIHDLRLAVEEVTGQDMNWFFNQWFLSAGHPTLRVEHTVTDSLLTIKTNQLQDSLYTPIYRLPVKIAYWIDGKKYMQDIVIDKKHQQFTFPVTKAPELFIFDDEQQLLGEIIHKKSKSESIQQYSKGEKYLARKTALTDLAEVQANVETLNFFDFMKDKSTREIFYNALSDPFWGVRTHAIDLLTGYLGEDSVRFNNKMIMLANKDPKSDVRAAALTYLSLQGKQTSEIVNLYKTALQDSSYKVVAEALNAYLNTDAKDKGELIKQFESSDKIDIVVGVARYYLESKDSTKTEWYATNYYKADPRDRIQFADYFGKYLKTFQNTKSETYINKIEQIGLEDENLYNRFAAYKVFWNMEGVAGIKEKRKNLIDKEQNQMLKNAYTRWEKNIIKLEK